MKEVKTTPPVVAQTLAGIEIFKALTLEEREVIASRCRGAQYETGKEIISYKERTNDVYFIVSGKVRATIFTLMGKRVSFRDIDTGQIRRRVVRHR